MAADDFEKERGSLLESVDRLAVKASEVRDHICLVLHPPMCLKCAAVPTQ